MKILLVFLFLIVSSYAYACEVIINKDRKPDVVCEDPSDKQYFVYALGYVPDSRNTQKFLFGRAKEIALEHLTQRVSHKLQQQIIQYIQNSKREYLMNKDEIANNVFLILNRYISLKSVSEHAKVIKRSKIEGYFYILAGFDGNLYAYYITKLFDQVAQKEPEAFHGFLSETSVVDLQNGLLDEALS